MGESPAVIYRDRAITYGELEERVTRFANALAGLGVGRDDKVAMMLNNCPEFIVTYFACSYLGAVAVPVNIFYKERELEFLLRDSDAVALVATPAFAEFFSRIEDKPPLFRHLIVTGDYPEGSALRRSGGGRLERARGGGGGRGRRGRDTLHLGHHRGAQGDHAHPGQPLLPCRRHHQRAGAELRGPRPDGGAHVPRLRHHRPALLLRGGDQLRAAGPLRRGGGLRGDREAPGDLPAHGGGDVLHALPPPRPGFLRPLLPAHRHLRGLGHARPADARRLRGVRHRHPGGLGADGMLRLRHHPAHEPALQGRERGPGPSRGGGGRDGRSRGAAGLRRHRRTGHPGAPGDEGLLQAAGRDGGSPARGLAAHRGHGLLRRRGLLLHGGPEEGDGQRGRREGLPARGGGAHLHPPGRRRSRGGAAARPQAGRDTGGGGGLEARRFPE